METRKILKREQVPAEYTWNLKDMYQSPADWDLDAEKATSLSGEIADFQGHLADNAATLLSWYQKSDKISLLMEQLMGYASLAADQDLGNNMNQARNG